ncbi:MAG: MFS transporter [Leptonema sp. (in: bacteria)]
MELELIKKRKQLAILIFLSLVVPYILVYFHRVAPAVVSQQLMSYYKITGAELGNLSAMYFYIYTVMQIPAGIFADFVGPKKVILFGSLISGIGSIVFGFSNSYSFALMGRFFVGLGVSVIFISILKLNQNWFDIKQFSFLSGITIFLGNLGALIATTPLAYASNLWGWQFTFVFMGILGIFFGILSYSIIYNYPEEKGLPPPEGVSKTFLSFREILKGLLSVIKNPYSWFPFISFFGVYGSLMTLQGTWGIPYLIDLYNIDKFSASQYLMYIAFGLMVGSPLQGYLAKRFFLKSIYFFNILIFLICFLIIGNYKINLSIIPYIFFLIGLTGSSFIFTWTLAKNIHPSELAGVATGIANMGGFLGAAVLQPLFGYVLDLYWKGEMKDSIRIYDFSAFQSAFIVLDIFLVVSLFAILASKEHKIQYDSIKKRKNR